jgi:hypothetical protein
MPHRLPFVSDAAPELAGADTPALNAVRAAHTARELRWLLLSPPLLDTTSGAHPAAIQQFTPAERQAIAQWLGDVDRDPEPLWRFVHPGVPAGVDAARWRAPSPRLDRVDTLATKLNKMFGRQLRHTPPAPWDTEPWTPAACTRGRLFYRWGDDVPATPGVAADHLRGDWIERDRLGELTDADRPIWQVVPRSDWMAPPLPMDVAPPRTLLDIACQIDSQAEARSASGPPTATLVCRLDAEDGSAAPAARPLFIVSAT